MRVTPSCMAIRALLLLSLACPPRSANGAIIPSFDLDFSAGKATHIVLATEGGRIDGVFQVLESWKGDLRKGDTITVPELAEFASEESRMVKQWGAQPRRWVTGAKMILFLVKSLEPAPAAPGDGKGIAASRTRWLPASSPDYRPVFAGGEETRGYAERMKISVAWVEDGTLCAFHQDPFQGPLLLMPVGRMTVAQARARILERIKSSSDFEKAAALPDPAERAAALVPLTEVQEHRARERAFNALGECGAPALPLLRRMLQDPSLADRHYLVVKALAKAGGIHVGPEVTSLLRAELAFWKAQAPLLTAAQWNDLPVELRLRHIKLEQAVQALAWIRFPDAREAVIEIRGYWESEPRLNRLTGGPTHNSVTFQCKAYLREVFPEHTGP